SARLEELQAQARGQATRIRMKALREAVELNTRAQALAEVEGTEAEAEEPEAGLAAPAPGSEIAAEVAEIEEAAPQPTANGSSNGHADGNGHAIVPGTSWEPG